MSGMDETGIFFLLFAGGAVILIVTQVLMFISIWGIIIAVFGTIFSIIAAILGTILAIIWHIVKWTRPVWYPIVVVILWLWFAFVKIAAVAVIVAGILWGIGQGHRVTDAYHAIKGRIVPETIAAPVRDIPKHRR